MKSLTEYIKAYQINEARLYKGGEDLAKYICKLVKENPDKDEFIINKEDLNFPNIFFKHLFVYVNEHLNEELVAASYHTKKYSNKIDKIIGNILRWDDKEKIFNYVEISLQTTSKEDRDIDWTDISHELNHLKQDYDDKIKNPENDLFGDIDLEEYNISRKLYSTSNNRFELISSYIKYANVEFERESFSVQATEKFKENLDKYNNFSEALDWQIKHNKIFIRYFLIYSWFTGCKESKDLSNSLCDTYRKTYKKSKNLSNEEIIDFLTNSFEEYYKALTEDINNILDEYGKKNAL